MEKVKFVPMFIYRDEAEIKRVKRLINNGATHLNTFINKVVSRLIWSPTNEDKLHLRDMGMEYIYLKLKKNFPFKNASVEFNLEALGINLEPLKAFHQQYSPHWLGYNYTLDENGLFVPETIDSCPQVSRHIYYTKTTKQNEALTLAKEFEELFSKAEEKGYLQKFSLENISSVTSILEYAYDENKKLRIVPDYHNIARLK